MIEINNLQKTYGSQVAIDIPHLTLQAGECIGLVGNNGAGKTTLFRLLLDLLRPDRGTLLRDGKSVAADESWKLRTGAYIDHSFLMDFLTAEEFFIFVGQSYGLSEKEVAARLLPFEAFMHHEILNQEKLIRHHSAGNQQKIGIIAALLHHPQLVILDEPFNFLDPSSQMALKQLLKSYQQDHQATLLVSSHNLTHIVDLCSHILLMEKGIVLKDLSHPDETTLGELMHYFQSPADSGAYNPCL